MKKIYTILIYNYNKSHWEEVFHTDCYNLAKIKYRQLILSYHYHNYIMREEVVLVD